MVDIDHFEKTGEGEIVSQNLINFCWKRGNGFVQRLPLWEDDGDLDKGRCIDIKIDPRLSKGRDQKTEENKEDENILSRSI